LENVVTAPLPPPAKGVPWSKQLIAQQLTLIYGASITISQYASYFTLQNFNLNDFRHQSGVAMATAGQVPVDTYTDYASNVQLFLQSVSDLSLNATTIFALLNEDYKVFVVLDNISTGNPDGKLMLPYHAAKLLSSAFTYGLATRLILGQYQGAGIQFTLL
jgi:hypothetical protein